MATQKAIQTSKRFLPTSQQCLQLTFHRASQQMDAWTLWVSCQIYTAQIKADNFIGWPLLTTKHVKESYPQTTETTKVHLNQSRKMYIPPSLNLLTKSILTNFMGEKNKMSMSTYMMFVKQFSPTKPDSSPHVPSLAISTLR